jgi:HlyD family secretion protein
MSGCVEMADQKHPIHERRLRFRISIRVLILIVLVSGLIFGWVEHRIRLRSAESAYTNAKLTRIVAETALAEYVDGIYKQDVKSIELEISSAETRLRGAEELLGDAKRMGAEEQKILAAEIASEKKAAERAKFVLARAQKKRETLEEITKPRTIAVLNIEIEKAKADEAAKYAAFQKAKVTWMGLSW